MFFDSRVFRRVFGAAAPVWSFAGHGAHGAQQADFGSRHARLAVNAGGAAGEGGMRCNAAPVARKKLTRPVSGLR
ncbi:hypothetical protein PUN4_530084 [Paraburkholderia unamae]|nr:hypothetical protein PUN4_530084 [Paraburkholderia unamae]